MKVFVVMDKTILGRGVFGIFSTNESASAFSEQFIKDTGFHCEVRAFPVPGTDSPLKKVFVALTYNSFYDTHVFDGVYACSEDASDAAGVKGMIVSFSIDKPEDKETTFL